MCVLTEYQFYFDNIKLIFCEYIVSKKCTKMIYTIISSNIDKAMKFSNEMKVMFHEYAQTFEDFTPSNDTYYIRSTGATSMRKICITISSEIIRIGDQVQFIITDGYVMGSRMDNMILVEQFIKGFKKYVETKINISLKCAKYDKSDDTSICGNLGISLNIYLDEESSMCLCVDPRHAK